jgi:hypothetical protein
VTLALFILSAALVVLTIVFLLRPPPKKKGRRRHVKFPQPEERERVVDPARVRTAREAVAAAVTLGEEAAAAVVRERFPDAERLDSKDGVQLFRVGDTNLAVEAVAGDAMPGAVRALEGEHVRRLRVRVPIRVVDGQPRAGAVETTELANEGGPAE